MKILFFFLLSMTSAHGRLIQILHTNDLHSFFEGTRAGLGGYSRLKSKLLELRLEAEAKRIPTVHLDGGDFGEGSSFFFSDKGADSLRALDHLGVDVTVVGNHDYMLGGKELARQILRAKLKAKILSANLAHRGRLGLKGLVGRVHDLRLEGLRIRIVGLSTPAVHFQYPLLPLAHMKSSHAVGLEEARRKSLDGIDVMIALTHTGIKSDRALARLSRSYDLIIGGHDHFRFEKPFLEKNLDGFGVPIFQAGAHSIAVGSIILEIEANRRPRVVSYKLHEISDELTEEEGLKEFVVAAQRKREEYFGRSWGEVIGYSHFPFNGYVNGLPRDSKSCWSEHLAQLSRRVAAANFSAHLDDFQGEEIPAGPIRFGDLIDNFPHFRKWNDKGWQIVKAKVPGFVIQLLRKFSENKQINLTIAGPVNRIFPFQFYTLALPSEVTIALMRTLPFLSPLVLRDVKKVPQGHYWPVLEDYIRKNSPLTCGL
jgi:2',3'-cyclic-nucleotide 2'-phosphodiesterase (5'-nucleotidase family)